MEVYDGGEEGTESLGGSGWLNKTTERVFDTETKNCNGTGFCGTIGYGDVKIF